MGVPAKGFAASDICPVVCLKSPPMIVSAIAGSIFFRMSWPMPVICAACAATARDTSFEPNNCSSA